MRKNSRKNKTNTAKLGVMFIVVAMALAGVGAGYSAWFDTITIEGTVGTGNVDIVIKYLSGTEVWKDLDNDACVIIYYIWDTAGNVVLQVDEYGYPVMLPTNGLLVAYAYATKTGDDQVTFTYNNLFPSIDFIADVALHYDGTIPVKVNEITWEVTSGNDWIEPLIASGDIMGIAREVIPEPPYVRDDVVVEEGYQLHQCEWVGIALCIHLPQQDDLMGRSGSATCTFEVVQWNEYPYDGGECGDEPDIGHNADVMLTLDTSGSILGYEAQLQDAAKAFVTALLSPDNGQVGIVSFASSAYLEITFSMDIPTLHGIIDGLGFGGGTNLEGGIILSQIELAINDRTPDADYPDYMVIITDGNPTVGGDPLDDATAAKAAGTRIFVLGIGIPDSTLLTQIASPGDYYDVADWDDLEAVLLGLI